MLLDEPSRGMHPCELEGLREAQAELRDEGNTVIVVEHDPLLIRAADHIIDMGPEAGTAGGRIAASGTLAQVARAGTPTGKWLRGEGTADSQDRARRRAPGDWLTIRGARENNLRALTARIPLRRLVGICGVSGSGKSTLAVRKGAEHVFHRQRGDGSWPLPERKAERELFEPYSMIPLQTGLPLRGLAAAGYAADPRAERAYEWLLEQQLPDGAWPSGVKGDQHVFPAGYRRLAHSRFGCRTNTSFAVSALALHPTRRTGSAARRGLDLLLAHDTLQASNLGYEVARTIGVERARGFFTYFARYDAGFVLDLCWRVEASLEDARLVDLVEFVKGLQGHYGLWEYGARPEVSRWVSFDLLRSLSRIDMGTDWVSLEPRTPFQPYPTRQRRY